MGKFGTAGQPIVGRMGMCSQCKNKAEVAIYPGDNPDPICEDCYRQNIVLETEIQKKAVSPNPAPLDIVQSSSVMSGERFKYIECICNKATDEWLDKFIREVIADQVIRYDLAEVLKNDRWFTILDLRRYAKQIDQNIDQPKPEPEVIPSVLKPRRKKWKKTKSHKQLKTLV